MPIFKGRRPMKKKPMGAGPGSGGGGGKPGPGKKGRKKKRPPKRVKKKKVVKQQQPNIENTGMESLYLKELIDSEKIVVVVLVNGEQLRGYVRYYDRNIFSIGPADGGPKIFIHKSGVRYLYEE